MKKDKEKKKKKGDKCWQVSGKRKTGFKETEKKRNKEGQKRDIKSNQRQW